MKWTFLRLGPQPNCGQLHIIKLYMCLHACTAWIQRPLLWRSVTYWCRRYLLCVMSMWVPWPSSCSAMQMCAGVEHSVSVLLLPITHVPAGSTVSSLSSVHTCLNVVSEYLHVTPNQHHQHFLSHLSFNPMLRPVYVVQLWLVRQQWNMAFVFHLVNGTASLCHSHSFVEMSVRRVVCVLKEHTTARTHRPVLKGTVTSIMTHSLTESLMYYSHLFVKVTLHSSYTTVLTLKTWLPCTVRQFQFNP